jgi:Mlc titration factor MtfA (ptsG expression regulator)
MLKWLWQSRRNRILARPFPDQWLFWLNENVAHYPLLPPEHQQGLRRGVAILVAEKFWEGCAGLAMTDEIKVTISGQASLMLLGIDHDFFERARTILVYPTSFRIPGEHGEFHGQSRQGGPVILAWDRALAEGRDPSLGDNLVIHEFAHQLDEMDGFINGTPFLEDRDLADRWHAAMNAEFARLCDAIRNNGDSLLGDYAATGDAEFFSVASERFYTVPHELYDQHPALFELLAGFYKVDPRDWLSAT